MVMTMLLLLIVVGFLLPVSLSLIVLVLSFDITSLGLLIPSCSLWLDLNPVNSWLSGYLGLELIEVLSLCLSPQVVPFVLKQLGANDMLEDEENLSKSISSSLMSRKSPRSLKALENLQSKGVFWRSCLSNFMYNIVKYLVNLF